MWVPLVSCHIRRDPLIRGRVTGGGGGIGYALSEWFLAEGKQVILVGRTESKLQEASKKLGKNVPYYVLDTGDIESIPSFVQKVIKAHPEVDCLLNNAGVQRPLYFDDFDLAKADQEIVCFPYPLAGRPLPSLCM
jgi:short-subunit dehydrogenase involved in D-alanine esterification of teichoic acids